MRAIHRFLGPAALLLCVASLALLGASLNRSLSIMPGDTSFVAESGALHITALTPGLAYTTAPREFTVAPAAFNFCWLPKYSSNPALTQFTIPLWLASAACGALSWRLLRTRTLRNDICARCRYNLAGLPAGSRCPECGTSPQPAHIHAHSQDQLTIAHA